MYKKIVLLVVLCFLFTISCSSPSNPDNGNQGNNGDGGSTTPTEEELLVEKYGIDIGQADAEISKQIEANLKAYYAEKKSYRVIFTGTPKDSYSQNGNKSLYALTLKAASKINTTMNIELDIKNINFQDGSVKTGMFSGEAVKNSENIVISFTFPENKITTIGVRAFESLYNTKEITIPDSVITIEERAFQNSQSIVKLTFGKNLKTIGKAAFLYIQFLSEVIIPDSVTSIEAEAFANNTIQKLQLSSSLEKIGYGAFTYLQIEELTIPASVKTIGTNAFAYSFLPPSLERLVYLGETPDAIAFKETPEKEGIFYYCINLKTLIVPNALNEKDARWQNFLGGSFTTVTK